MKTPETLPENAGERNVEYDRLAFIEAIKNTQICEIETEFDEVSVESLITELGQGKLLLLAETHGVKENVDIIYTLFKKFGFRKLALEWSAKLIEVTRIFLDTGDLDFDVIKNSPDGRITAGHFALIKKLKEEGLLEELICFDDNSNDWDERDRNMAGNIISHISDSITLAVAGNLHAQVEPITLNDDGVENHPMGESVKKHIPSMSSGRINYHRGQYYNLKIKDFTTEEGDPVSSKARFYKSGNGIYSFDLPEAHIAVVPNHSEIILEENEQQSTKIESILSSIMTTEEYSKIEHDRPYIFELKSGSKELYYFGSPHMSDPSNPLFKEIEAAFNKANPDIVFVEGINIRGDKTKFNERVRSTSHEEAINMMGESGLTLKLGVDKGIDWESPEPTDEDLYNDLLSKGFTKDEVFAWDVFHILPQYNRQLKHDGFKQYVSGFIDRFRKATNWENFDYSYERAIRLGEEIFGENIDVENDTKALDRVDPIPWEDKKDNQTVLNRISAVSGLFRDRKIVKDILEAFDTHDRVFVVYGASHAAMQKPAFRKAFGVNEI